MNTFRPLVTLLLCCGFLLQASCQSDKSTYAVITTGYGDITIRLYNSTPRHRDNFIKLTEEKFYDYLLIHRVIKNFVIQGGDPKSKDAHTLDVLGQGDPGYKLEPEIGAIHVKGAVGAARQDDTRNPERLSNGSQFYIVHGAPVTEAELDQWEAKKGIKYTPEQRKLYLERGGLPFLDMEYTVFGEVVEGLDVLERMAEAPTHRADRPTEDIRMLVKLVKK
jgi:cyclophilin family peptidyl-prolyl cis-trans isomerase